MNIILYNSSINRYNWSNQRQILNADPTAEELLNPNEKHAQIFF
jgi:hypothetical protein